jgi:hypothetical protein
MNRLDTCRSLVEEAMRCLENGDKECVMRKIEELIKADCHNGYAAGKKIADGVRELVHGLWLASNREEICGLLRMLKNLNVSKGWVRKALSMGTKRLNKWIAKCGIDWEGKVMRNDIIRMIESLLRERFGWSEVRMCEEMWRFVGVDVNEFRKYGVDPCVWLEGLESLRDLRRPYWLGLAKSDLAIDKYYEDGITLILDTTNVFSAVFFAKLLSTVKTLSLAIKWERSAPAAKYVRKAIKLEYYVNVNANDWPWPIELSAGELERILDSFSDEELTMFVGGLLDGDGTVWCGFENDNVYVFIKIVACKTCPKRAILDVLKRVIARRFGIVGCIYSKGTVDVLQFRDENAIRLLKRIAKYVHHPLRRLRIELILAFYDGRISLEVFKKLYDMAKYEQEKDDIKRNHALEAIIQAAPQTHTHGGM